MVVFSIVAHGPFIINTRAKLVQAFDHFNLKKFDYLED
jgi:redox-sensitive bicupin YhaK (pirin superfamily)